MFFVLVEFPHPCSEKVGGLSSFLVSEGVYDRGQAGI